MSSLSLENDDFEIINYTDHNKETEPDKNVQRKKFYKKYCLACGSFCSKITCTKCLTNGNFFPSNLQKSSFTDLRECLTCLTEDHVAIKDKLMKVYKEFYQDDSQNKNISFRVQFLRSYRRYLMGKSKTMQCKLSEINDEKLKIEKSIKLLKEKQSTINSHSKTLFSTKDILLRDIQRVNDKFLYTSQKHFFDILDVYFPVERDTIVGHKMVLNYPNQKSNNIPELDLSSQICLRLSIIIVKNLLCLFDSFKDINFYKSLSNSVSLVKTNFPKDEINKEFYLVVFFVYFILASLYMANSNWMSEEKLRMDIERYLNHELKFYYSPVQGIQLIKKMLVHETRTTLPINQPARILFPPEVLKTLDLTGLQSSYHPLTPQVSRASSVSTEASNSQDPQSQSSDVTDSSSLTSSNVFQLAKTWILYED